MKLLKKILQWLLAVAMILAGVNHFLSPQFYVRMMPPILPAHLFLIYLSGAFEIALGVLLLVPRFTRLAAGGLIALFIAVFPANLYMWLHPELFPDIGLTALGLRLPLQFVLIAWAYWFTRHET